MENVWNFLALLLQGAMLFGVINFAVYFAFYVYENYREKSVRNAANELFLEDTQKWDWNRYVSEQRREAERANDQFRKSFAWTLAYIYGLGFVFYLSIRIFYHFKS